MGFRDGYLFGLATALLVFVVLIASGALDGWIKRWRDLE